MIVYSINATFYFAVSKEHISIKFGFQLPQCSFKEEGVRVL